MMKCSILIANYNNGRFFRDCYNSIIAQTWTDWEAVILDDCSTDNSVELIKEIIKDDSRFRFFQHPQNEGVGVIKAQLIELAEGKICCYVDPDDAITPTAIQKHMEVLSTRTDVVLTHSRLVKCDENLKPLSEFKSAMQVPNGDRTFFNCPVQIAPLVCFRKSAYLKVERINASFRIAEDQDLYYKLYEKGHVKFVNQTDYLYRGHSGGISQNDNKRKSYEYWAMAIFSAMQRRGLKSINGVRVPDNFPGTEMVFKMLEYQNKIPFRIRKKIKILLQNLF